MYSYGGRMKAMQLYIKYNQSISSAIREPGYPTKTMLLRWYKENIVTGDLKNVYKEERKYSETQKQLALEFYLERCIARTAGVLGSPSRSLLQN